MKSRFPLSLTLLILLCGVPAAAQDIDWGLRAGITLDPTDPFVGVEAVTPLTDRIFFNPNVEVVFREDDEDFTINADAHYDFNAGPDRFVWAGAGIGAVLADDNDFGLNLIGGYGVDAGALIPYAQAKVFIGDDTDVSIAVGIRF